MARVNGRFCCECDYCRVSPCDHTPIWAIFLTDYAQTHDYEQFCDAHMGVACDAMIAYIVAHPDVAVDETDGAWDEAFGAFFAQRTMAGQVQA